MKYLLKKQPEVSPGLSSKLLLVSNEVTKCL